MGCVPNYIIDEKADVAECSWLDQASFLGKLIANLYSENTKCIPSCKETKYRLRVENSEPIENVYDPLTVLQGETSGGLETVLFGNKTGIELLELVQFEGSEYDVIKNRLKKLKKNSRKKLRKNRQKKLRRNRLRKNLRRAKS